MESRSESPVNWESWVIDATISKPGEFCFVPVKGDIEKPETLVFVTGINYGKGVLPEGANVVAVIHKDGDEAATKFYEENKEKIDKLNKRKAETNNA